MGLLCLTAWVWLFGLGLFIDSGQFLTSVKEGPAGWDKASDMLSAILTYTVTNVAILACLSGLLGGLASHIIYETIQQKKPQLPAADASVPPAPGEDGTDTFENGYLTENPVGSMLRSFSVFLAFIAGTYIFADKPFSSPSPEQYARVAGSVSLVSFLVGYDPTIFSSMLKRFVSLK